MINDEKIIDYNSLEEIKYLKNSYKNMDEFIKKIDDINDKNIYMLYISKYAKYIRPYIRSKQFFFVFDIRTAYDKFFDFINFNEVYDRIKNSKNWVPIQVSRNGLSEFLIINLNKCRFDFDENNTVLNLYDESDNLILYQMKIYGDLPDFSNKNMSDIQQLYLITKGML